MHQPESDNKDIWQSETKSRKKEKNALYPEKMNHKPLLIQLIQTISVVQKNPTKSLGRNCNLQWSQVGRTHCDWQKQTPTFLEEFKANLGQQCLSNGWVCIRQFSRG